ncbi:MAG TPA: hypothetical protein VMD03_08800 [Steroidobacteraceae bacterium]|nr:hypothetical protein [Steroidobacteraceae bacterium]
MLARIDASARASSATYIVAAFATVGSVPTVQTVSIPLLQSSRS